MITTYSEWEDYLNSLDSSNRWYTSEVHPIYSAILLIVTRYEYRYALEPFSLMDLVEVNRLIKELEKEIMFQRLLGEV